MELRGDGGKAGIEHGGGRVLSIQLLRGIAAFIVAVIHTITGFATYLHGEWLRDAIDEDLGAFAVSLFFVISGYVMVVSSRHLFGRRGGWRVFALRRAVRILPSFWIATALLGVVVAWRGYPFDWGLAARSLALVPGPLRAGEWQPQFALWPGWTLFYEALFYTVFAAALALFDNRYRVIGASAFALVLLVAGGVMLREAGHSVPFALRAVSVLFIPGMALALLREGHGLHVPPTVRWLCAVGALAAWLGMSGRGEIGRDDVWYVASAGFPAILAAIAALGGPLRIPAPRVADWLGDTSFAVYLLHVPVAHLWTVIHVLRRFNPWSFLVGAIVVLYLASWAFHRLVERPLTGFLNRRLGGRPRGDGTLEQSGV
jgi:exopolysaccharide production protein ExoZ